MHLYNIADLHMYYRNAYFRHPDTGELLRCGGQAEGYPDNLLGIRADGTSVAVHKKDLEWEHVRCPELGYRTWRGGTLVLRLVRHAGRHTSKGFHPNAIYIEIPDACKEVYQAQEGIRPRGPTLDFEVATETYCPTFMTMREAVAQLSEGKGRTGFALSPSWAVTLGTIEGAEFLLHLKGVHVAYSSDGLSWNWLDDSAEELYNLSSIRG